MRTLLILTALSLATVAHAGDPWLSLTGAYNTYEVGNTAAEANNYTGYVFDSESLDSGLSVRAAVGVELHPNWSLGAAYELGPVSTTGGSETDRIEADCYFHSVQIAPCWYFHRGDKVALGLGAELGLSFLTGTVDLDSDLYGTYSGDISGSGVLGTVNLTGEIAPSRRLRALVQFGFRQASFDDVTAGLVTLNDYLAGEGEAIDFGGLYVRAGMKWLIPSSGDGGSSATPF